MGDFELHAAVNEKYVFFLLSYFQLCIQLFFTEFHHLQGIQSERRNY